ncbi:hypothetical protein RQP46_002637 [Phenoliferia psychrophenolica]
MHSSHLAAIVLALAPSAFAQLSTFRGTIPGSLHQCENTTMDFFDSGATRPLDVLFLPSASVPTALLTGTTTLNAALKAVGPLFAIEGITTPDASAYPFILQLAAGSVVEIFAFLPDGTGKNLNLPRTIMTPLPAATNCLVNVKSIPGAGAVTAVGYIRPDLDILLRLLGSRLCFLFQGCQRDRARDLGPKGLLLFLIALVVCVLVALRVQRAPGSGSTLAGDGSGTRPAAGSSAFHGPNFDFDLFRTSPTLPETQKDDDEDTAALGGDDASDEDELDQDSDQDHGEDEPPEDVLDDDDDLAILRPPIPHSQGLPFSPPNAVPRPFLPFSCKATCPDYDPSSSQNPTCSKYKGSLAPNATYDPFLLDRTLLFPGTGTEVRRVLKRAIKTSLFRHKRRKAGSNSPTTRYEDEEPFQVLVLGGSVSNCRGVEPYTECWHSRVLDWFQRSLPLEGDPRPIAPDLPTGPQRLGNGLRIDVERRSVAELLPSRIEKRSVAPRANKAPAAVAAPKQVKHVNKAVAKSSSKKKGKKKKPKAIASGGRRRPITRLINAAKSATGSAFYAYCFEAEMLARGKSAKWGRGPDLIVLEFGVNDVWPTSAVATRDFERLLSYLRALPSKPALVILEAASLLLARTQPSTSAAEYLHLAPAHFHDVPVLSTKHALFGPSPAIRPQASLLTINDLFLPDQHHPNARGHELLADTLTTYLEREACNIQAQLVDVATERASMQAEQLQDLIVDPERDFGPRSEDLVLPRPERSLFEAFGTEPKATAFDLPPPTCLQVGNAKSKVVPRKSTGWTKYSWARDKQYLVADKPGSTVTYDIVVGAGGEVLADWLRSRFYDLGNVLIYMDGQKATGVSLAGWWDLGWSIGVPTVVFSNLTPGPHTVTVELLPPHLSSHPARKTAFRLIGLIST